MTYLERSQQKAIADLQARIALLEDERERLKSRLRDERVRSKRLQTTIQQQVGKHRQAVNNGRYWHGVAIANGTGAPSGE